MQRSYKSFLIVICLLLLVTFTSVTSLAQTATTPVGSGTEIDPYQIASLDNLYWLTVNFSVWDKHFLQIIDIDASTTSNWNGGQGFSPIGNSLTFFTGNFDGDGHTINELYINRNTTNNVGLFGYSNSAVIKNVGLINVSITGRDNVGSLVGVNYISSTISNSYSSGSVKGINNVGGLVGYNIYSSSITNSYSTGIVNGNSVVGGLVGYNYSSSTVSKSYSSGSVTGSGNYVGGLVGYSYLYCTVSNSYSTSSVTATSYFGGLVGYNYSSTISNSYSTGSVTGTSIFGGLVGISTINSIENNSFWDIQTSSLSISPVGTGKTTAEMKLSSTFTSANWDFVGETINGTDDYWNIDTSTNDGYPYLSWQFDTDVTPPVLTAPVAVTLIIGVNTAAIYSSPSATAIDDKDPNPIVTSNPVLPYTFSAAGVYTITYTATDANGNSSKVDQTVIVVPTTMLSKSLTLPILNGLQPVNQKVNKKIDKAIKEIQESLNTELWDDEYHLSLKKGEKVFENEKEAVNQLLFFLKSDEHNKDKGKDDGKNHDKNKNHNKYNSIDEIVKTTFLNVILILVDADKNLAQVAIDDAVAAGGKTKEIDKANKAMAKALVELGNDKYEKAIDQYKKAWEHAQKAGKKKDDNDNKDDDKSIANNKEKTSLNNNASNIPVSFSLKQNYPNPFNPSTVIKFALPKASFVTLKIYNMLGQEIKTLVNENKNKGFYNVQWNGENNFGHKVASGTYIYRVITGGNVVSKKMILLR